MSEEELILALKKYNKFIERNIIHKMYPACCTDPIQVFSNREEYNTFIKEFFEVDRLLKEL